MVDADAAEAGREEMLSLYNEVDVTLKENSLASIPHGILRGRGAYPRAGS